MYCNEPMLLALRNGGIEAFVDKTPYGDYLREQPLGTLHLATGSIVANDPLCLSELAPFEKQVPPGDYPVIVYVLHIQTDQRVAFAEVRFSNEPPVKFVPALVAGEDISKLGKDSFYGYGVDTGTGGFMDAQTCRQIEQQGGEEDDILLSMLEDALDKTYVHTYSVANVCLPGTKDNVVAFSSGYGDGAYPSFWGMDSHGVPCCLITDFCIVGEEEE